MAQHDQLHRYLFEQFAVRGELVTVSETWKQILENHNYPLPVKTLLGELLVATSLLTATLKFAGDITVQLQGDGPMTLAVINGNNQQQMRGVARVQGDVPENADLKTLVGNGYLVITISPEEGERYQGVVGLEGDTLAACLEDYFMRECSNHPARWYRSPATRYGYQQYAAQSPDLSPFRWYCARYRHAQTAGTDACVVQV
jgi:Disulfide bond chaperones of the HSP33 family